MALEVELEEYLKALDNSAKALTISNYHDEAMLHRYLASMKWGKKRLVEVKNMRARRLPHEDYEGQSEDDH